ncbi:MAG: hypothetical protein ACTSUE_06120 [Promethearchaeota archaeon]
MNFSAIVDNMDSTVEENITQYDSFENVTEFDQLFTVSLHLTNMTVYNDHDTVGPGDFNFLVYNGYYTPSGSFTYQPRDKNGEFFGNYNGGGATYSISYTITMFGWNDSYVGLHLYDDDSGIKDHIGTIFIAVNTNLYTYQGNGSYTRNVILDFNSDVSISCSISLYEYGALTASDIANIYLPYMYSDIDISVPDPRFEEVHARLLKGHEPYIGKEVFCIQAVFYWSIERTFSGGVLHYNDFEVMAIYIDPSVSWLPFRIAFDNGFYFNGSGDGDNIWWKCHDYTLYDDLGYTGRSENTYNCDFDISPIVGPFLGEDVQFDCNVKSYDDAFYDTSSPVCSDNAVVGNAGMIIPIVTLETFYHTFDSGLPNGGTEFGFLSPVFHWLNDTTIKNWYAVLQVTFSNGTHGTSGNDTPWTQPFHWDITDPFKFPLISNYDELVNNVLALTKAENSKMFSIKKIANFNWSIVLPLEYDLTITGRIQQGTQLGIVGDLTFTPDTALLRVDYEIGFTIDVNVSFFQRSFDLTVKGQFLIDVNGLQLVFGNKKIIWDGSEYDFENSFLSITLAVNPQLFGTILDVDLEFSVLSFLQTQVPGGILFEIFQKILGDVIYRVNLQIIGGIQGNLRANGDVIDSFLFNTAGTSTHTIDVQYSLGTGSLDLQLADLVYNLRITANHYLTLDFSRWLEFFFGMEDQEFELGTFPDITVPTPIVMENVDIL